ncbi:MAG: hypothetical protein WBP79_05525 [Candidatus Acidiferrales bacterium]
MPLKQFRFMAFCLLAAGLAISAHFLFAKNPPQSTSLIVHEWGTFTSVAGNNGQPVEWLPLRGSRDLPGFVEHYSDAALKGGLSGTVRLETPVLYFHAAEKMKLSVKVGFAKGIITEWYPQASQLEPAGYLNNARLQLESDNGSIAWNSVSVEPNATADFRREEGPSRYYAARETSASPIRVKTNKGDQQERFLFYRGVSVFPVPISARLTHDGKVQVANLAKSPISNVILFERRGEKMGYRVGGAIATEATLEAPPLTATMASLDRDLESMLVGEGLYQDEARAMIATWRDSWFEEGSRMIYFVPKEFVNTILPLSIQPAPKQTVRVFVGRLEVITPATEREVEHAFVSDDQKMLDRYGRFLLPILRTMLEKTSDPARTKQLNQYLKSAFVTQSARAQHGN